YLEVEPKAVPALIESLPEVSGALFNASHYSASCRVECEPICRINWYRNGVLINPNSSEYEIKETVHPEEPKQNIFTSVVSTLTWNMPLLAPLDRDRDNANFSCVGTSDDLGKSVESQMQFFVQYPPENLSVDPAQINVTEGEIPNPIRCQAEALPIAKYRWENDNSVIGNNATLHINHNIDRKSLISNKFTCIAFNEHGEARMDVFINLFYKPMCKIYEEKDDEEDEFWLICESDANPNEDLKFVWTFGNQTFDGKNTSFIFTEGTKSKVKISKTSEEQFGIWNCTIENQIGSSSNECLLNARAILVSTPWTINYHTKRILLISGLILLIVIIFIIILICLICCMRRRRKKQENKCVINQRENPDGSHSSSTPSSITRHVPSNPAITYKRDSNLKLKRSDKVIGKQIYAFFSFNILNISHHSTSLYSNTEPLLDQSLNIASNFVSIDKRQTTPHITPSKEEQIQQQMIPGLGKDMYENMAFHRKTNMLFPLHLKPNFLPQYENIAQLTHELRRTQSARYYDKELCVLKNGAFERNIVYADLQLKNNEDVKKTTNHKLKAKPCNINCITYNENDERPDCEYAVLRFDKTPSPPSPFGPDVGEDLLYADLYEDVKSGKIPDPRVKPALPPKGAKEKPPKLPPKDKKSS
ncbi:hemicentin-1-like protein, partial [Dinothrombium tinctorium]